MRIAPFLYCDASENYCLEGKVALITRNTDLNANSAFCALLPLPSICSIHIFFIFVLLLSSDIFTSGRFLVLQGPKILGEWISYWENLESTLLASKAPGTS